MTTSANAPRITEATVRALSEGRREPEWLLQKRLEAWRAYETMAMPDPLDEEWRRTDISGLDLEAVLADVESTTAPAGRAGLEVTPRGEGTGLVYTDLSAAARDHPEVLQIYLQSLVHAGDWKLQALQAALWSGALIHVPRGAEIEVPLLHLERANHRAYFPHLLIVAEANSSVTVFQETASEGLQGQSLVSGAVEIFARPDARVRFVELQRWGDEAYAFSTIRARLERGAELSAALVGLGGRLARSKLEVTLSGEGSRAELLGLSFGNGSQHFDYLTLQDHLAPRTASDLLFKAALTDAASEVWAGTVHIRKGAGQSEANQTSRNLLLSEHAKAAPIPVLEIEAYDVLRCSHGASAGPVDEDQRFYLESRGIPPREAEDLLVEAFFQEALDRLPSGEPREQAEKALLEKMRVRS